MIPEGQLAALRSHFDAFARAARGVGLADQQLAEWLLRLGARWLLAHGVAPGNVLAWVSHALQQAGPVPLIAAARSKNDFGGNR